ncbi:GntR family transcriptional regulator [Thalassospira lohafexi]|uniref:GntR family transcriptional regulator n=1 Tax=Thalassospira lohafexi TaxID=744227 RepID=A0A2N3LCA7_9PROT|nr:GntR family transcriptional regulator [Thalassospira lohafexi]PKR60409.1 GntR family transcriptional regulator [Thalassospira lohafexi]
MEPLSGRKSLTDEVHDRLVDALCSGALPPGTPLRQEAIAEELNVSRQPVLQALGLLRRDGLVEPMGRRGYRVSQVDANLVRHVYDLREAFDGLAARLAAQSLDVNRKSALRAAIQQGHHALGSGDTADLVAADVAFHQTIYRLSGNPLLPEASAAVWLQIRRVMHAYLQSGSSRDPIWMEHEAIADAICAGDGDRAQQLAINHSNNAKHRLTSKMKDSETHTN